MTGYFWPFLSCAWSLFLRSIHWAALYVHGQAHPRHFQILGSVSSSEAANPPPASTRPGAGATIAQTNDEDTACCSGYPRPRNPRWWHFQCAHHAKRPTPGNTFTTSSHDAFSLVTCLPWMIPQCTWVKCDLCFRVKALAKKGIPWYKISRYSLIASFVLVKFPPIRMASLLM